MKIPPFPRALLRGNILILTLLLIGLVGFALITYLTLVNQQTKVTARSQSWNVCMAVAEAGVEEALAHLNKNGIGKPNLTEADWKQIRAGVYSVKRDFGDGHYEVSIQMGARPVITSIGHVPAPLAWVSDNKGKVQTAYLSRTVQVQCRAIGRFTKAIVARDKIELNGKYVKVDSFNSYDPNASSNPGTNGSGVYDPAKRRDNGDVAVIAGLSDTLSISDAQVWGKVSTGPEGTLKTNKSVSVGDSAWHAAGNKGVQPGWSSDDASFDMPAVTVPYTGGTTPKPGWVGTNYYDYILTSDDYLLKDDLKGKVLVQGNVRLRVTKKINFKDGSNDDDGIEFADGARLELYAEGDEAKMVGRKDKKKNPLSERTAFNSGGNATNFMFFGTDKLTKMDLSKCDDFTGIIYAPNAEITLKAGSIKYYKSHLHGAVLGKKVKLEKNANLHYDENIANLSAEDFVVESWSEIKTPTTL